MSKSATSTLPGTGIPAFDQKKSTVPDVSSAKRTKRTISSSLRTSQITALPLNLFGYRLCPRFIDIGHNNGLRAFTGKTPAQGAARNDHYLSPDFHGRLLPNKPVYASPTRLAAQMQNSDSTGGRLCQVVFSSNSTHQALPGATRDCFHRRGVSGGLSLRVKGSCASKSRGRQYDWQAEGAQFSAGSRLLIHLLQELQDFPLARGGGIGGHVHGIPRGIKGDLPQVVPGNAQRFEADGNIQLPIERKQTLL